MKPEEELQSQRIQASQCLSRFIELVHSRINPSYLESFWECEEAFRDLLKSSFLVEILNFELSKIIDRPIHVPMTANPTNWTFVVDGKFTLNANIYSSYSGRSDSSISSHSCHHFVGVLEGDPVLLKLFQTQDGHENDVFNRSERLICLGEKLLSKGEYIKIRADQDVYFVEPSKQSTLLVSFSSPLQKNLTWVYDADTLRPVHAIAANMTDSRIEMVSSVLAHFTYKGAVNTLKNVLRHGSHFVRWKVIKALMVLDHDAGLEALTLALGDPHLHVRNAAKRTLDSIVQVN